VGHTVFAFGIIRPDHREDSYAAPILDWCSRADSVFD
jgi:hypothetical protein